jgi:putative ABC transport system ATP-binding protein
VSCTVDHVTKRLGDRTILHAVSWSARAAGLHAIVGPSGSGKTTLLNLIAGLDTPDAGTIEVAGVRLDGLSRTARAAHRARTVGFVFQRFNLLPTLTVAQNIHLPHAACGRPVSREHVATLLRAVGIGDLAGRHPHELSGGQQQRVAVVRALAGRPSIVLADEPTGSLDQATGASVIDLLTAIAASEDLPIVLVTHDHAVADRCATITRCDAGRLVAERR